MSDFSNRLDLLLSNRSVYSWGVRIGLAKATIAHLKNGGEPRGDTLRKICAIERCSIEWLSTGKGSPFEVNNTQDADETFRAVAELIGMSSQVLLVHDGSRVAIAIGTPLEAGSTSYTEWRVIAGPVNADVLEVLKLEASISVAHAPPSDMQRLISGEMGNWELIGVLGGSRGVNNPNSIYSKAQYAANWMSFKALTDRAFPLDQKALTYGLTEPKTRTYGDLSQLIDKLPPEQRDAIELIVRVLLRQH